MCAPCNIYRWYLLLPLSLFGLVFVGLVVVCVVAYSRRDKKAFVYVDEENDVVSILMCSQREEEKEDSGGLVHIAHNNDDYRGWWRTPGGRFSSVVDVSEEYASFCQALLNSQSPPSLTVVGVYHVENSSLWGLYTATQSSILSNFPKQPLHSFASGEDESISLLSSCSTPTLPHYNRHSSSVPSINGVQPIDIDIASHPVFAPIFPKCYQPWMAEKLDLRVEAREAFLFHGTTEGYVNIIKDQGFDARVGSLHGNFGSGCYFSDDVGKAIQYATPDDSGVSYLFLGRVCLGCPYYVKEGHHMKGVRRAPTGKESGRVYDSVIGCVDSHYQEYVVYEKAQCYPELLIAFKGPAKSFSKKENSSSRAEGLFEL